MSVVSLKTVPEELKTTIIKVCDYHDKNPQGFLYNPFYGEEVRFQNLTQLLLVMETIMDGMKFPKDVEKDRCFKCHKNGVEMVCIQPQAVQKVIGTFKVKVLFRQGASWQGKLTWVEGKQEIAFRSALELIKLMDSALS